MLIHRLLSLFSLALVHLHHDEAHEEANHDAANGIEQDDHCARPQASVPGSILGLKKLQRHVFGILGLKILHSHYYVLKKASLWLAFFPEAPVKAVFE